ncbi:hypothetical protein [Streptomyces sp. NPDC055243]|uniref:hypothetical protein n=1 Tax=Streptomyces sp. NPDC055243 TaxID=3365720 RepID=UPI0037D1BC0B
MSDKMTCFGCDSHTSSVLQAFQEGGPCPYCGLSAETMLEIRSVRRAQADEALKAKCEETLKELGQTRADLRRANARLAYMESLVSDAATRLATPLSEEEIDQVQW